VLEEQLEQAMYTAQMVQIVVLMGKSQLEVVLVVLTIRVIILVIQVVLVVAVQRQAQELQLLQVVQEHLDRDMVVELDIIMEAFVQQVVVAVQEQQDRMPVPLKEVMEALVYLLRLVEIRLIMQVAAVVLELKIMGQLLAERVVLGVVVLLLKVLVLLLLQVHQIQEVVAQVLVMLDGQVMPLMVVQES
jgi:hypothetical protein